MNSSIFSFKKWIRVFFSTWILLFSFFLLASEILIRSRITPEDSFEKHRHLFFSSEKRDAVFGDSHGAQGFTGQPTFINLSFPSESIDMMASKIKLYYAARTPQRVVLPADPHLFANYRVKEYVRAYTRLFENPKQPYLQVLTPRHRKYLFHYWKGFFGGSDFKSRFHVMPDGSQIEKKVEPSKEYAYDLENSIRLQKPDDHIEKSASFKKYKEMLEDLKKRNAEVCLVTFPVSPAYAALAVKFPEFERTRQLLQEAAGQFDFAYANYWDTFKDPELFRNEDHLNYEGAMDLTQKIMRDCFGKEDRTI